VSESEPEKKSPFWKNPFLIAFFIGAVFLTVLPFAQRRFLKAPPPVMQLTAWDASPLTSSAFAGKVVLLTAETAACPDECMKRQGDFGTAIRHVDDLGNITLITLVSPEARTAIAPVATSPLWKLGDASPALLSQLEDALNKFLPPPGAQFAQTHAIVLIDQNNAVRGFWPGDAAGRGNSINAARLLAKEGPIP
jgi:hypothetical protein